MLAVAMNEIRAFFWDFSEKEEGESRYRYYHFLALACSEVTIAVGKRGLLDIGERLKKSKEEPFDFLLLRGGVAKMSRMAEVARKGGITLPEAKIAALVDGEAKAVIRELKEVGVDILIHEASPLWFQQQTIEEAVRLLRLSRSEAHSRSEAARYRKKLAEVGVRVKEEMERQRKRLETKDAWFASMVHELRTPLNGIIGLTHLLGKKSVDEEYEGMLRRLQGSAEILKGLVNDLLDLSKIEAGKLEVERIDFDLNEVLDKVANVVRVAAEEKGLALIFDVAHWVPATIQGDPLRLSQVLINLINNAIKFTERGEITLRIGMKEGSREILFEVIDTGVGIEEEKLATLFDAYIQAERSTSRKYGGTGLGLAIARHIVLGHGGRIWVESESGQGATFLFTLPRV